MAAFNRIPWTEPAPRPNYYTKFSFWFGGVTQDQAFELFQQLVTRENISYIIVGTDSPETAAFKNYQGFFILRREVRANALNARHPEIIFRATSFHNVTGLIELTLATRDHIEFGSIPIEH